MTPATQAKQGFEVAQERDVVAARRVTVVFCAALLVSAASVGVSGWILSALRPAKSAAATPPQRGPRQIAAVHQTPIARERHGWQQRAEQRRALETYRWIDRGAGSAQIPIERAMQLVIEQAARPGARP